MIDSKAIRDFVERSIEDSGLFIVDVRVSTDNVIVVELDGPQGVDIDTCVQLSRLIEAEFPREPEDYELEVGGAGLTAPFKVLGQYLKNIGNRVELLLSDGRKLKALLLDADADVVRVSYPVKTKVDGQKKPVMVDREESIPMSTVKKASLILEF